MDAERKELFLRAADVVGEYIIVAVFPEIDSHLVHEPIVERVVGDYRATQFSQDESDLGRVLSLAAIIAACFAGIAYECKAFAFLETDLAGTFSFGKQVAVLAAASENVAGHGS